MYLTPAGRVLLVLAETPPESEGWRLEKIVERLGLESERGVQSALRRMRAAGHVEVEKAGYGGWYWYIRPDVSAQALIEDEYRDESANR